MAKRIAVVSLFAMCLAITPAHEARGETAADEASLEQVMVVVVLEHQGSSELGSEEEVDVVTAIVVASERWGLDANVMLRVAWCESRWDPLARGPGGATGVFQFVPTTWQWASVAAGFPDTPPTNLLANVETAAWLYKHEGPRHWTCK